MDSPVTEYYDSFFKVPILFIMFNRPKHARSVLDRIRQVHPSNLYIAIDGPRSESNSDIKGVEQCISLLDEIDWPCKITKLIRNQNLGCKVAVSSAITWFFEHVEAGIILEDDCLPDLTFFSFCQTLLLKYADNSEVMHIGGANLYKGKEWGEYSYFFSKIAHIWGWATWRRAWAYYDVDMKAYPHFNDMGGIDKAVSYPPSRLYWTKAFSDTYEGLIDTWDYQWVFSIWNHQGLCIIPNKNLITNIGFGDEATHTVSATEFANIPTIALNPGSLRHPDTISLNGEATSYAFAKFYQLPSWWQVNIERVKRLIAKFIS